jgi:hypothetical protein
LARAAGGVEDRQPRLSRGIKAAWSNLLQRSSGGLLTVLAVNIKQFGNGCILAPNGRGPFLTNAAESLRERIADSGDALGAHSWELPKPAVMCRRFKFLQAFDAQILVELPRGYLADAGHRSKAVQGDRVRPGAAATWPVSRARISRISAQLFPHPRNLLHPAIPSLANTSETGYDNPVAQWRPADRLERGSGCFLFGESSKLLVQPPGESSFNAIGMAFPSPFSTAPPRDQCHGIRVREEIVIDSVKDPHRAAFSG